jgi:hypothetical protein
MTKGQEDERRKINSSLNSAKPPATNAKPKLTEHNRSTSNTCKTKGH